MRRVEHLYTPRHHQDTVHESLKRWSILVCHRRFGKTVLCINQLIREAVDCPRDRPRYAYIAPLYRQAKQVAWDYLKYYTSNIPGVRVFESDLRVDLPNGARIQLFGSDNPDALRGVYLDGVVLDEYAQMPPSLWSQVIRPALTDRRGWAIFIGTPKGRNGFFDIYSQALRDPDWYAGIYRASETGIISEDELRAARHAMSENEYAQEFECSFEAAVPGAYYGKLMCAAEDDGRICSVPHDPSVGVETWWDLGIGDPTAIWFVQRVGKEIHVIDYLEARDEALPYYVAAVRSKGWVYNAHVLPHDAEARELQTGLTRLQALTDLGLSDLHVIPRERVAEGIEAVRRLLPMAWFDRDKCARGIEALRQYHQEWDDRRQTLKNVPYSDWTNHGADAFRMGAMYRPATRAFRKLEYPKIPMV